MYMAADNGLYDYAVQDIIQMQKADIPSNVKVIVQSDFPSAATYSGTRRFRIEADSTDSITSPQLANLGNLSSGDPRVLNTFIKWGFEKYPAQRKMLVIWSHGDSWYKNNGSKWICPDESSEELMSIAGGDMSIAFSGCPQLDILLLDACSMQSVEVITELKDYADYIIASEDLVPLSGFPYDLILPIFDQNIEIITESIPQLYTSSYEALGSQNPTWWDLPVTCSTIKTDAVSIFNTALKTFVMTYRAYAPHSLSIRNQCYEMNTMYAEIDLREFLSLLSNSPLSQDFSSAASNLLDLWEDSVIAYSAIGHLHDIGTATIWFPAQDSNFQTWWHHYYQLDFANSLWLSWLNNSYGADQIPPEIPEIRSTQIIINTLRTEFSIFADPDPLSYHIELRYGDTIVTESLAANYKIQSHVIQHYIDADGYIKISVSDLSGNTSVADSLAFFYDVPLRKLIIAPNPVYNPSQSVIKYFNEDDQITKAELKVYDLRGRKLVSSTLANQVWGENRIHFADHAYLRKMKTGKYFVQVKLGKHTYRSSFVVIN